MKIYEKYSSYLYVTIFLMSGKHGIKRYNVQERKNRNGNLEEVK